MNKHEGSSFESFLEEEGILEECTNTAKERIEEMKITEDIKNSDGSPINEGISSEFQSTGTIISGEEYIGGGSGDIDDKPSV